MSDRKYGQHGYQDKDKKEKGKERERAPAAQRPRQEQFGPRTPRMVGSVTRARCANCGAVLLPGFDPTGKCSRCEFDLHCCKQCVHFDTAARFECTQEIPERIANKNAKNECTFFEFRTTVEKDTSPSGTSPAAPREAPTRAPNDARKAFDDLFKK
jgi:hypothetical protein